MLNVELQLTAKLRIGQPGVNAVRHVIVDTEPGVYAVQHAIVEGGGEPEMSSRNQSMEERRVQM